LPEPKSKRVKTEPGARDHAQGVDAAPDAPPPEMPIIGLSVGWCHCGARQIAGNHRRNIGPVPAGRRCEAKTRPPGREIDQAGLNFI
jgi:hypothetical protein